jgi:hypothetical protein
MTTVAPNDSTIRRSDPIRTRASSARPAQEQDWSQWEAWMEGHKKLLGEEVVEAIAQHLTDPLEKRIRTLENELALANGKLAILSGKGVPGTFNIKGTFDARSIYNYLDVVAYNGASWVATRDNPGHELPGPGWQLLASQGSRGVRGERGERGPAGAVAKLGGARFSPRGMEISTSTGDAISLFKSVSVDAQNFALKFTAGDDSTLTISLLPLFQSFHAQTASR